MLEDRSTFRIKDRLIAVVRVPSRECSNLLVSSRRERAHILEVANILLGQVQQCCRTLLFSADEVTLMRANCSRAPYFIFRAKTLS